MAHTVLHADYTISASTSKHGIDELKQRLIDTLDCIPQGIINEASGKHGCVHV